MGDQKTDMNRIGVFKEMEYHTIGDNYKNTKFQFNDASGKGKQMLPPGSKTKNATQAGYFEEKFPRVFEGEAYSDPIKQRRQARAAAAKANVTTKAWLPSSGDKKGSGLGSHYGTIGGKVDYFNAIASKAKPNHYPKNFLTNPSKKGTGYGYIGVGLDKYPENKPEEFSADVGTNLQKQANAEHKTSMKGGAFKLGMHPKSLFNENPFTGAREGPEKRSNTAPPLPNGPFKPSHPGKNMGGSKQGGFEKWPKHSEDKYVVGGWPKKKVHVVNSSGKTFIPSQGIKDYPINSIINQSVAKAVNPVTYRDVKCVTACC